MNYKLTEKEHFIRNFWVIVLTACLIGGTLVSFLFLPPAVINSQLIATSLGLTTLNWIFCYYFVYKKHNNFVPFLILYLFPIMILLGFLTIFVLKQPTLTYEFIQVVPQFAGLIAYYYLNHQIRYINKKIQFQKHMLEDYETSIEQLESAQSIEELEKIINQLNKKYPKYQLFFKYALKEQAKKLAS